MAHFNLRREQLEMRRSLQKAFPPETLLAIRDAMLKKALAGNIGAAKVLFQYFGVTPPRVPDTIFMAELAALADELRPLGEARVREVLGPLAPLCKPSAPYESETN